MASDTKTRPPGSYMILGALTLVLALVCFLGANADQSLAWLALPGVAVAGVGLVLVLIGAVGAGVRSGRR